MAKRNPELIAGGYREDLCYAAQLKKCVVKFLADIRAVIRPKPLSGKNEDRDK